MDNRRPSVRGPSAAAARARGVDLNAIDTSLLDVNDEQPVYSSGQRPPLNDDELLHTYNLDHGDDPFARPSLAYDEYVGGAGNESGAPSHATNLGGAPSALGVYRPHGSGQPDRIHPQTSSDASSFERYSDLDDYPEDQRSVNDLYHAGVDGSPSSTAGGGRPRDRNSVMSLGGGLMGRAKTMLGMGPQYSEMDVPLTEAGVRAHRVDSDDPEQGGGGGGDGAGGGKRRGWKSPASRLKIGFGRGKADLSKMGPRIVHLNNPPANSANRYVDNHVSTAKYNVATFLPKFLFQEFSKFANMFFLFTAIIQQIPGISPTNRFTTIGPLAVVLLVSALKELFEDFKRKTSDKSLNHSKAQVLKGSDFQPTRWINVAVGDVVRVESEEAFPADLVLQASSEPEGLCYIETANLDGETNLKIKQALPETAHLVSPTELSRQRGRIRSEQPNSSLYTYEATLTVDAGGGEKELALSPEQLLLRGATLRNTPWIHGVVVFTGHETKLMRNAMPTPIKRTAVERMLNYQIVMLVGILLVLSLISSIGNLVIRSTSRTRLSYLEFGGTNAATQFFSDMLTYWILYSNLVPISLFVTVELVKYYHAFLINSDLDIYYDTTDTPAVCRTSSLVEELGQIQYIFSDKTGTLTCNQMEFKQCSIAGIQYGEDVPEDRRAVEQDGGSVGIHGFNRLRENLRTHETKATMHDFLVLLATCHTVIPERSEDDPDRIKYQAASPDEGALVEGAVELGYRFTARKPRSVMIAVDGEQYEYELLAVCEFNSTRKRMSAVYRCPDGRIRIYCKGADTVIIERLVQHSPTLEATLQHLEDYATEGLRTLCLATREIPEEEFQEWNRIFEAASTTVGGNRAEELQKAAEVIERDFHLLGATAIEDRLQDGVPDTIHTLQTAGIKVWVLTGDRQETAINIGMSCKLISEDMTLLIVNEETSDATRENISKKLAAIRTQATGSVELDTLALVIDGKSLIYALEKDMEKLFLDIAVMCKAVICWYERVPFGPVPISRVLVSLLFFAVAEDWREQSLLVDRSADPSTVACHLCKRRWWSSS